MSAPSTPKPAAGINGLTPRENEILGKAWGCLKSGPPEIDYEKLAGELNMANHRSASNAWSGIKKKMAGVWGTGAPGSGAPDTAKSTGGTKRKKAVKSVAEAIDSADDDEEASPTAPPAKKKRAPAAKPRAARAKKVAVKALVSDVEEGDEEVKGEESEASEYVGKKVKPAQRKPLVKAETEVKAEEENGVDARERDVSPAV